MAKTFPLRLGFRGDADLDLVKLRAADRRLDLAGPDVKVDYRSVADVSPAARQAVRIVHVGLQVVAPRLAPEGAGNHAALDLDGPDGLSLLSQLGHFPFRFAAALGHRDVGSKSVVVPAHNARLIYASVARFKSSATKRNNSWLLISVISFSPPPSSNSADSDFLSSMTASMRSSIVPRQTNLWTRTFCFWAMRLPPPALSV